MALTFPAPFPDGFTSIRFFQQGTATANYVDNQFNFVYPKDGSSQAWSRAIKISASGGDLSVSFDGTTLHGVVKSGTTVEWLERCEGGLAVKGAGVTYIIEAW